MIAVSNPVGGIGIKPIWKHRKIIKIKNRATFIRTALGDGLERSLIYSPYFGGVPS